MSARADCRRCAFASARSMFLTFASAEFGALPACPRCHSTDVDVTSTEVDRASAIDPPRPPTAHPRRALPRNPPNERSR